MKKKIAIIACLLMMTLFAVNVNAETKEKSFANVTVEVPNDWEYHYGDKGSKTYYFPSDSFGKDGQPRAMISYDYEYNFQLRSNEEIEEYLNRYVESYKQVDGFEITKNEDINLNGIIGKEFCFENNRNEKTYVGKQSILVNDNMVLFFELIQEKDFAIDYTEGYDKLLSSLRKEEDEKEEFTKYEYGMNKVGTDIPAGEYVLYAQNRRGYFCVSSDSNQEDIIFNENFDYNSIISINDGEYLKMSHCYAIPISENPDVLTEGTGMFKVGLHIPAGEYKLEATDDRGYYCIYPDSRQDDIIANDIFEGKTYVTVADGQYLVLSGCKFVDPPEKPIVTYTDADTVKRVQEALNAAGYDCGTPDGSAGNMTVGQIQKYQTDKGLNVTGTITDELLESLGI